MKKITTLFLISCFALCLSMPLMAADKAKPAPVSSYTAGESSVDTDKSANDKAVESKKTTPTKTAKTDKEKPTPVSAPTAASAATPVTPPPAPEQATKEVKSGVLEISDAHISNSGSHIDVFLSIKNTGKTDERISGAGTKWTSGDVVQVTKDKDGKEQEAPVSITLTAGKTTEISKDGTWIRIKDVKAPKDAKLLPFSLYFRSAPNADLKIDANGSSSGGLMDWLKK